MVKRSGLFLDRDGVLNDPVVDQNGSERSPWSLAELQLVPAAKSVVNDAVRLGLTPVVVTNQPDISRGYLHLTEAIAIKKALLEELPGISDYYFCPHVSEDGCACRKPAPGMLFSAAKELHLDLSSSWLVGDRWVDIAAATAAGVRSVLIERSNSWLPTSAGAPPAELRPTFSTSTLRGAMKVIRLDFCDE